MKTHLSLFAIAAFAIPVFSYSQTASTTTTTNASAASAASAQTGQSGLSSAEGASAAAAQSSQVSAELTKKIDTKDAKVGDEVTAKITSATRLADGTKVPRGTKLVGKVTEAEAKEGRHGASHLAFTFDHAMFHDGRQLPIHAMMTSLSAPAALAASADGSDDTMASGGAGGGMMAGSGGGGVRGGGGLLGGAGGAVHGAAAGTTGLVDHTAGGVASASNATLQTTAETAGSGLRTTGAAAPGAAAGTTQSLERVPVGNLPGVTFSSSGNAGATTALDATGRNIDLASGSQMMLNLSASTN